MAPDTRTRILEAARACLLEAGYANLSTRAIAEQAGLRMGHLHYHFGSKRNLILALFEHENRQRLERQEAMYSQDLPLWKRWEQACDFLDDDLASGYVRVMQELIAAGWSEPELAETVRDDLRGWFRLLQDVADEATRQLGPIGPFEPAEIATLVGNAFIGAEALILLGFTEDDLPHRTTLRKVGEAIRALEEG